MGVPSSWRLVVVILFAGTLGGCGPGTFMAVGAILATSDSDSGSDDSPGRPSEPCDPPLGNQDGSFGLSGWVLQGDTGGGGGDDRGYGITVDPLGRILVSGQTVSPTGSTDMVIWRFREDGTLDPTFNGQGWATYDGGNGTDYGNAGIAVDSMGRIIVAGMSYGGSLNREDLAIWCFLGDGSLDASFNGQGWVTRHNVAGGDGWDMPRAMALDENDRIVLAGASVAGGLRGSDMVVLRYDPAGTPDMTFGSGGFMIHHGAAGGDGSDSASAIALDGEGRILVAGSSLGPANNLDMVVWRLNAYGMLDGTFGTDGFVVHVDAAGGRRTDVGNAVAVDEAGRILVAGSSEDPTWDDDAVIWRFNSDGTLDTSFMGKGFVIHDGAAGGMGGDHILGLTVDCSGGILASGFSQNPAFNYDMVIWRYEPTGALDAGFGSGGIVVHDNAAGGSGDDRGTGIALDGAGRLLVAGQSENPTSIDEMVVWCYE